MHFLIAEKGKSSALGLDELKLVLDRPRAAKIDLKKVNFDRGWGALPGFWSTKIRLGAIFGFLRAPKDALGDDQKPGLRVVLDGFGADLVQIWANWAKLIQIWTKSGLKCALNGHI